MPVIGTTRHATQQEIDEEADQIWREHVVPAIVAEISEKHGFTDEVAVQTQLALGVGTAYDIAMRIIRRELVAFYHLQLIVSEVYSYCSNGQISRPIYNDTSQICGIIDDAYADDYTEDTIQALRAALPINFGIDNLEHRAVRGFVEDFCSQVSLDPKLVLEA